MLKAIIFDLDGVVAETESIHMRAFQKTFEKFNIKFTQEYQNGLVGFTVKDNIIKVKSDYKIDIDVDEYVKKRNDEYYTLLEKNMIEPNPGFVDILSWGENRKVKFGICSSSKRKMVEIVLNSVFKNLDIEKSAYEFFDVIATGDDARRRKPYPDLYLYAVDKLCLNPIECLAIEDSKIGIESARSAGCKIVALKTPYFLKDDLVDADKIVNSLEDLIIENFWGWFDND